MTIDFVKVRAFLEQHAKPKWEYPDPEWLFRSGGGEAYIQEKVLANGSVFLTQEAIRLSPVDGLLNALRCHVNLLSQYDLMFAKVFILQADQDDLGKRMVDLLHGDAELTERLRKFLDWARVEPVPGEKKKKGINPTVTSYLLALSDPQRYAYCKPIAYNAGVVHFLGKQEQRNVPIERLLHCNEFYREILDLLTSEYGLQDGNLFDVHSLLYFLNEESRIPRQPPEGPNPPGVKTPPEPELNLHQMLLQRHNVLLYGPPGTGKTREVLLLANWWKTRFGDDSVVHVTFHPSYCYEDFVEGYRPDPEREGFRLRDGIFKRFCAAASKVLPAV